MNYISLYMYSAFEIIVSLQISTVYFFSFKLRQIESVFITFTIFHTYEYFQNYKYKLKLPTNDLLHHTVVLGQTDDVRVRGVDDVATVKPLILPFAHVVKSNEGHLFVVFVS